MFLGSLREKSYKSFQILQILLIKKDLSDLYRFVRFLSVRTLKLYCPTGQWLNNFYLKFARRIIVFGMSVLSKYPSNCSEPQPIEYTGTGRAVCE